MAFRPVSACVLAGGRSRRMGRDKALLQVEGRSLLARVLLRLASLTDDLLVAGNDLDRYQEVLREFPSARLVPDAVPATGPLGGMYTGLQAAGHEQVIVVACDMPFLNVRLLDWMIDQLPGHSAVVPRLDDRDIQSAQPAANAQIRAKDTGLHPLHAVYHRTCLETIDQVLAKGETSLGSFISALPALVRFVSADEITVFDPHCLSLRNVNTPEEYVEILRNEGMFPKGG